MGKLEVLLSQVQEELLHNSGVKGGVGVKDDDFVEVRRGLDLLGKALP